MLSDEVYECTRCAGEIAVTEAVWLPEAQDMQTRITARPYCCKECFDARVNAILAAREGEKQE